MAQDDLEEKRGGAHRAPHVPGEPVRRRRVKRFLMRRVVPGVVLPLLACLRSTWRLRESGREHFDHALAARGSPVIAVLHGRSLMLLNTIRDRGARPWFLMCSKSADGDAMTRIEEGLGFNVVRGSSGRGGLQAIVDMIRAVREHPGAGACLAVDGSRGPRGHVQGGIIALAQRTGGFVLPVTVSAHPAWIFRKSWDRALLAKPFSRVHVVYGEPVDVPARLKEPDFTRLCLEVETRLIALQAEADALSGCADTETVRAP